MPAPKGNQYSVGNRGGAPEKYSQAWLKKEAEALEEWMKKPESIYFKSFALERGYHPNRLAEFAEKSEALAEVYALSKDWQECRLVNYGCFNKINSGICKFILANHHGFSDKTEISGNAANPLSFLLTTLDGTSKELIHDKDQSE